MFAVKFKLHLALLHTPTLLALDRPVSIAGSSAEVHLQKLILKHPHRQDLKLKLMDLKRNQHAIQSKQKSKRKKAKRR